MTIGKRKGVAAKGAGAQPGSSSNGRTGGSLSKNDHNYLTRSYGLTADPGSVAPVEASGGQINDYTTPTGDTYRAHIFVNSGTFAVTNGGNADVLLVGGGGGGGGTTSAGPAGGYGGGGGAGGFVEREMKFLLLLLIIPSLLVLVD